MRKKLAASFSVSIPISSKVFILLLSVENFKFSKIYQNNFSTTKITGYVYNFDKRKQYADSNDTRIIGVKLWKTFLFPGFFFALALFLSINLVFFSAHFTAEFYIIHCFLPPSFYIIICLSVLIFPLMYISFSIQISVVHYNFTRFIRRFHFRHNFSYLFIMVFFFFAISSRILWRPTERISFSPQHELASEQSLYVFSPIFLFGPNYFSVDFHYLLPFITSMYQLFSLSTTFFLPILFYISFLMNFFTFLMNSFT